MSILFRDNTAVIRIRGLRDSSNFYLDDATVSLLSLTDAVTGASVDGVDTPIEMSYVPGSNGTYEGTISHNAVVVPGRRYTASVRAVSDEGHIGQWEKTVQARIRKG
jgi:hypothetical protein